jgi:hypothetical protein
MDDANGEASSLSVWGLPQTDVRQRKFKVHSSRDFMPVFDPLVMPIAVLQK